MRNYKEEERLIKEIKNTPKELKKAKMLELKAFVYAKTNKTILEKDRLWMRLMNGSML